MPVGCAQEARRPPRRGRKCDASKPLRTVGLVHAATRATRPKKRGSGTVEAVRARRHPLCVGQPEDTVEQILVDEQEGTRTWAVSGCSREELVRRVTLIFAEHVHDNDEVHIAYNAMQTAWQDQPPRDVEGSSFTELFFEYSALIVVRRGRRQLQRELNDALWALVERLGRV